METCDRDREPFCASSMGRAPRPTDRVHGHEGGASLAAEWV